MDYDGPVEAAITSDLRGEPHNFALWDTYTGTQLVVFKGSKNAPLSKCLQLIDNNFFLTVNDNVIHIWSIYNKKHQEQKLFLPKRPTALCVSPCTYYLIVGQEESLNIWNLKSGNLLSCGQRHHQNISAIKVSHDGAFIVSAGEDGNVLVWSFADLISQSTNTVALKKFNDESLQESGNGYADGSINEPRFIFRNHNSQVTDLHLSLSGLCFSTSIDMNLNLYDIYSGTRLSCIAFPSPLWSVAINKNETQVFVGGQDGNIYELVLNSLGHSIFNSTENTNPVFEGGHNSKVNFLRVSMDGSRLISGSADSTCKIWNTTQRKLLHDIRHQGALANLDLVIIPDGLAIKSMSAIKPSMTFKQLKRSIYQRSNQTVTDDDLFEDTITIKHSINRWLKKSENLPGDRIIGMRLNAVPVEVDDEFNVGTISSLKTRLTNLYRFAAEKIFKDSSDEILKTFDMRSKKRSVTNEKVTKKVRTN